MFDQVPIRRSFFLAVSVLGCTIPSLEAQPKTIAIQVKSFIARMVTPQAESSGRPDAATNKSLGFDNLVGGRVTAYELMLATDQGFRENPADGTKASGDYRVWSQLKVTGRCLAGKVVEWSIAPPEVAFGKEGPLQAVGDLLSPLSVEPSATGHTSEASVRFRYAVKGRPNALTIPAFDNVRPRSCTWIWHDVSGTASCSGDSMIVATKLAASGFPSHRVWLDGRISNEQPQGPFENLWKCSNTPGLVR